jgi:hypothetical protein
MPLGPHRASTVVLALVFGLVLAGCGGSSGHATPSRSGTTSPASPTTSPRTTSSDQRHVDEIALGSGDLGPGWTGSTITNGATLGSPTLDLCERTSPSDKLRTARRQTLVLSRTTALSTEVVTYRHGGAAQALREAAAIARSCRNVSTTQDGQTFVETITPIAGDAAWGADAVAVAETATENGESVTTYAVYQADGDTLAAVYDFGQTASKALIFQIANLTAARLRAVLAGTPPPTATVAVPPGPDLDPGSVDPSSPDDGTVV